MNPLLIEQTHALSAAGAERLLRHWLALAQSDFGLRCTRSVDPSEADMAMATDTGSATQAPEAAQAAQAALGEHWAFAKPGLTGSVMVQTDRLRLQLHLGFLLRPYAGRIEAELRRNLVRDLAVFSAS